MTCGFQVQKKVADGKSILIFKSGGQESVLLSLKVSEVGESLPCLISLKNRDGQIVNSLFFKIKVLSNQDSNLPEVELDMTDDNFLGSSLTDNFSRLKSFYKNNNFFNSPSTIFSDLSEWSDNFLSTKDSARKGENGDGESTNLINFQTRLQKDFPALNNFLKNFKNNSGDPEKGSNNFLKNYLAESSLSFKILSFISEILSDLHNFIAKFFSKLLSYFLPTSFSNFLGENWLTVFTVSYLTLLFKKIKKRYWWHKRPGERIRRSETEISGQEFQTEEESGEVKVGQRGSKAEEPKPPKAEPARDSFKANGEEPKKFKKEINNYF